MDGQATGSQPLAGGGLRKLASEIGGPRPAATVAAAADAGTQRQDAVPARGEEGRATRP
ncbi:MAG TPA: hypothetical protein VEZ20_13005 [Allosphingosinicella sp.]|jgi:hypothetical protein|nr:hypothetical protein [Allosphingosinicella sp.]